MSRISGKGKGKDDNIQVAWTAEEKAEGQRLTIVLCRASLETVKTKKGDFELLNMEDHKHIASRKSGINPADIRPDITHQELLALLDSPLNKAGRLQVYIHTTHNVLIEVSPQCRIPRTFKRFSGLMVQLLHKLKIRAANDSALLLRVVKNPISRHLPPGARSFVLSVDGTLYNPLAWAGQLPDDVPIVLYVGAMANGHITLNDVPEAEEVISLSGYPLSRDPMGNILESFSGSLKQHKVITRLIDTNTYTHMMREDIFDPNGTLAS